MKELIQIGFALLLCNGAGQQVESATSNSEKLGWAFVFCITCAFLAGCFANYIVNRTFEKFSVFFRKNFLIAFVFGMLMLLVPSLLYLINNLQSIEMYDFPFVILWSLFAAVVANFLLSKLSVSKLKSNH